MMERLRPEAEGRESEMETREGFEKRTGITKATLSGHFTRYADKKPKPVAKKGKQKYYLPEELDAFIKWVEENSGTRSDADIARADIARLEERIEETEERKKTHQEGLRKAERDLSNFLRQIRRRREDLAFLEKSERDRTGRKGEVK